MRKASKKSIASGTSSISSPHSTERTWTQYFFNQSGEVSGKGANREHRVPPIIAITDTPVILALRERISERPPPAPSNDPIAAQAIREHFNGMNATLRRLEKEQTDAEAKQLDDLEFANRAYRRPLTVAEREDLLAYYPQLRNQA